MKKQSSMARKRPATTKGRAAAKPKPARKKRAAKKGNNTNLKSTLYGLGLWALGLINAAFIFSFVMKMMPADGEAPISSVEQVAQSNATAQINIEVLNGCGVSGLGKKFADYLKDAGFQVEADNVGNYSSFEIEQTIIVDRKSVDTLLGLQVAQKLGLPSSAVIYQKLENASESAGAIDVRIIIGKDYQKVELPE